MKPKKYCFCLDLKDNAEIIRKYKEYHAPGNVWPEIIESISSTGIVNMEMFLAGNRMFMIMTVDDDFDVKKKAEADANNEKVQAWEKLMWEFQQALPWAGPGEKWIQMDKIFDLAEH